MNRKHCILLYSNHSQASIDLLTYIKELPLDLPQIVGLTPICIDSKQFKDQLQINGIEYVPTLLVEYYKGDQLKQKFERDQIYRWIDQVMKSLQWPVGPPASKNEGKNEEHRTYIGGPATNGLTTTATPGAAPTSDLEPQIQKEKVNINVLAQQMAKDRDSYISSIPK